MGSEMCIRDRSQGKSEAEQTKQVVPQRHRLPLWEPFAVLGILAILVGVIFYNQKTIVVFPMGKNIVTDVVKK